MRTHPLVAASLALSFLAPSAGALASPPSEAAPSEARPLRILLTSDDGVAGAGLAVLRDALCAAGHRVTVVAPSTDRSGSGTALTLNQTVRATRTDFTCGDAVSSTWALTGTPSDAVLFGLSVALGGERPDVVVSGINYGQNVGRAVNHSGTVGAAVTAAEEGVPALAVSIAINAQDAQTGFSQTRAAAPFAAAFVNDLLATLQDTAHRGDGLLPDRVALNVNVPVVLDEAGLFDASRVESARVTVVGHGEVVHPQYVPLPNAPAGTYVALGSICGLQVPCDLETVRDADTTALEEGALSVTPLAVDGAVDPSLRARIHARLRR